MPKINANSGRSPLDAVVESRQEGQEQGQDDEFAEHSRSTPSRAQLNREGQLEQEVQRLRGLLEMYWQENDGACGVLDRQHSRTAAEARYGRDRAQSKHSVVSNISLAPDAEDIDQVMQSASESEASYKQSEMGHVPSGPLGWTSQANVFKSQHGVSVDPNTNISTLMGSALSKGRVLQAFIYLIALGGCVFVLVARSTHLGEISGEAGDDAHRRLGGGASLIILQVAFCFMGAGLIAFLINLVKLPLILGYLLGGVLVGPIGLDIVHSQQDIADFSSLGLILLLFMIGLELDVSEFLRMGKVVIGTGLLQFPICAGIMAAIFMGLEAAGLSFGEGDYSALYMGVPCGISSTMIVVKLLSEHAEMDSAPGRLTVGILIFQDIWAIIMLAIQPDLANPQILGLLKTFAMIIVLGVIALFYAKFVMPAVFMYSSKSVELMLIISLAWCFFMGCFATLPFIGLSLELAALISGVALASFPYSAEFNGKIKYIRDFFITLFFVGLGMQIPIPTADAIGKALLVVLFVLVFRWVGIFCVTYVMGGGPRLAAVATINLSQVSEFALVLCSLGIKYGHIGEDSLTIIIWTFSLLAILSSFLIGNNYRIYGLMCKGIRKLAGRRASVNGDTYDPNDEGPGHVDRNIVLLGFHKIAAMLIAHFEHHNHTLLDKVHVIDFHEHIMPELRKRGVTCAYGDISSPDVLEHAHHGDVRLVISSIPDSVLRGVTNMRLLQIAKQVWPEAQVIVTADTPGQAALLYEAGADYVLRMAKLCAERLHAVITDHSTHAVHHHHIGEEVKLENIFAQYRDRDTTMNKTAMFV